MGSSLPKLPSVVVDDVGGPPAEGTRRRRARRIVGPNGPLDSTPTRPSQGPVTAGPRETPTITSLATAKLAEEETRLAKVQGTAGRKGNGPRSGISSSDHRVAAVRDLYAQGKADEALSLASDIPASPDDPFGGLIPVEDDEEIDPFGGLIPVPDSLPKPPPLGASELSFAGLELDDPTESVPSAPSLALIIRKVPRLLVEPKELAKLPMDPRAAFLVGHVDGFQSMEEILDVCAMPEAEALDTVERLCSMGVLSLD